MAQVMRAGAAIDLGNSASIAVVVAPPAARPAPKATLVGMPAVTATPTPSNPPPAETSSASAPPSDDDAKKGEE